MTTTNHGGSASIAQPEYWWYQARTNLLQTVLSRFVGSPARVLDVGSADGPSVVWLKNHDGMHVTLDIDPRGLEVGGVCGSALDLPFADGSFEVVSAFDVLEHCEPESAAVAELARVLAAGGTIMISVPAYQWAWCSFDDQNGHHRRYTRGRAIQAIEAAGLTVERATYAFGGVFPFFAAQRVATRLVAAVRRPSKDSPADIVGLPQVSPALSRLFLALCRLDQRILRRTNLPFGSSVIVAATKPR